MNDVFTRALDLLTYLLDNAEIQYNVSNMHDGYKVTFSGIEGDVVCHRYSQGGEKGKWESFGFASDHGDVTGNLTPIGVMEKVFEGRAVPSTLLPVRS